MCPAPVRTPRCAATRRSRVLTGLRVDSSWVSPSPARPQTPQDAALVRCRVTSHGLSLRLERGSGVSAGLLHFAAGEHGRVRHQAHRITEAGPGAWSAAAARLPAPAARASRARTRVIVSGKRPNEESGFRRLRVLARRRCLSGSSQPSWRPRRQPPAALCCLLVGGQLFGRSDDPTQRASFRPCVRPAPTPQPASAGRGTQNHGTRSNS